MNNQLLTRTEGNILKGLAILGIVLHNYCHWLKGVVQENEYQYFAENSMEILRKVVHPDDGLFLHLLSFFGHYGVPVFLFLSAYGLEQKYASQPLSPTASAHAPKDVWSFVKYHFMKLFKMMIVGFVAFTMVDAMMRGSHHYALMDVVGQLFMFNNLMSNPDAVIWPGPYWFFGLMLQFYVLYRILIYRRPTSFTVALIVGCWLLQVFCDPEGDTLNRLRYNFIGGMLPFGAGILYSRYVNPRPFTAQRYAMIFLLSTALVVGFSFNYQLWYWIPLFVCVSAVSFVKLLCTVPALSYVVNLLEWLGALSAALFVCHPILRKIFIPVSYRGDIYTGLLLYSISCICVAWLFRELMKKIPNPKI